MTTPLNNEATYLPRAGEGSVPQWNGTYAATVVNNHDPLGVGRLQLNVPQVLGNAVSSWAVPAGSYYNIPNNGATVSCVFLGGDPSKPAWSGPLDLAPIVVSAAPPSVTYSPTAPTNPRVGDVWYPLIGGVQNAPEVWTFNSGTSTYSWVVQPSLGTGGIAAQAVTANQILANTITAGQVAAGTLTGIYTGAAYFGQNMVQDPAFSSTLLNTVRTTDPVTNATWTLSGGTAAVTAGTPAKRLALMPSGQPNFFVTPGEQFYLSITGTVSASCQIGIEIVYDNAAVTTVSQTSTGTFSASGTVTVPAGAKSGYVRIFAFASSGSPTATLSNPAVYFGQLQGPDWVLNSSGFFFYSGTPAAGNLAASITTTAGTDAFGNAYLAGSVLYGPGNSTVNMSWTTTTKTTQPILVLFPDSSWSYTGNAPYVTAVTTNKGLTSEYNQIAISSGNPPGTTASAALDFYTGSPDGTTSHPRAVFWLNNTNGITLGGNNNGFLPLTQTDNLFTTQTSTSASRLFKTWAIPNNDFTTGTVYRLTSHGIGNWGGVPVTFDIASPWGTLASLPIGGTLLATGTAFMWDMTAYIMINQTGSSGIVSGSISLNLAQSGGNQLVINGTANTAGGFVSAGQLNPVNVTTTGGNYTVQVAFGTGGTSPSITSWGSVFERIGATP